MSIAELNIDLRQMILAIETAVSLVGMNDTNHGKRVGYIAAQIGRELGFSDDDYAYTFELGLLHDCGVSTAQMHSTLVNYFDWNEAKVHCEIGYNLLKDFKPLAQYALPIRYHHTHWTELQEMSISPRDRRMANLIFLADRIDISSAKHYGSDILIARREISESFNRRFRDSYFDGELLDAFLELQRSEAFWISLEDRHILRYTYDMGRRGRKDLLSTAQVRQLAMILAFVVDQKSPFTAEHSVRVADCARFIAEKYGMDSTRVDLIEIAGLVHDLGKLHTPDNILEKPGPLDELERSIMNQHSYETYEILRPIEGMEELAQWAAYHHEGIDGSGYPFHPQKKALSTEARIIAVADVFQALVQDRPYRRGMELSRVLSILDEQAAAGRLDSQLVALAKTHSEQLFTIAKGDDPFCNQDYRQLMAMTAVESHAA